MKAHAILGCQSFATLSVAKVGRINAAVAGVTDGDGVATVAAQEAVPAAKPSLREPGPLSIVCFPIRAVSFPSGLPFSRNSSQLDDPS